MMSPTTVGYRKVSLLILALGVHGRRLLSNKQQASPTKMSLDDYEKRFIGSLELSDDDCYDVLDGDMLDGIYTPEDAPEGNAELPDVYCHFRSLGEALCVAKKRDGDFTDIFMYNAKANRHGDITSETRSCQALTYPPIVTVDKGKTKSPLMINGCGINKGKKRDVMDDIKKLAWRKIRRAFKDIYRNMRIIDNDDDNTIERTHLLIMPCDIDEPNIDFETSVVYQNPKGDRSDKFDLFFTGRDGHRDQTYTFRRLIPGDASSAEIQNYASTHPAYTAQIQQGFTKTVPRRRALKFTEEVDGVVENKKIQKTHTMVENGISQSMYAIGDDGEGFTFVPKLGKHKSGSRAMVVHRDGKWTILHNVYKSKYKESLV